jgi:hypothetical protein
LGQAHESWAGIMGTAVVRGAEVFIEYWQVEPSQWGVH